nr:glycoside hydrolase family 3 protein [uncultured Anaeromusa sp.]
MFGGKEKRSRAIRVILLWLCLSVVNGGLGETAAESKKTLSQEEQVEALLQGMTLEEKVGQLLWVGIAGTEADAETLGQLRELHAGGVVLFDRNMQSPAQVKNLIDALQKQTLSQSPRLPLLVSVDQEGGRVLRMREQVLPLPSQAELGSHGSAEQVENWAAENARELMYMGFNVNFAPVVDIGLGAGRSFAGEAAEVTRLARAAVLGYRKEGMFCTLKHFPGIGKAPKDPHQEVSDITVERDVLEQEDLVPFRSLIKEFDTQPPLIMVSHLRYPAYDAENPACISEALLKGVLRRELGFEGLIVTDDLEMGAMTSLYSFRDMGVMAVGAGADALLVCHNVANQKQVYTGILEAVKDGRLPAERLDEAVRRVLRTKLSLSPTQE